MWDLGLWYKQVKLPALTTASHKGSSTSNPDGPDPPKWMSQIKLLVPGLYLIIVAA